MLRYPHLPPLVVGHPSQMVGLRCADNLCLLHAVNDDQCTFQVFCLKRFIQLMPRSLFLNIIRRIAAVRATSHHRHYGDNGSQDNEISALSHKRHSHN